MALRNFWVTASIDGRKTLLEGGPQGKLGGMTIRVYQRDEGVKTEAAVVRCWEERGKLVTVVERGGKSARFETGR